MTSNVVIISGKEVFRFSGTRKTARRLVTDGLRAKGGQLLFPFMEGLRDAAYGERAWIAWLRHLDLDTRRTISLFNDRTWHLLMLGLRCPGATDLMQSCPALAFALASSWVFRGERKVQQPLRSARSLLRKRQRVIADWLGFPGSESAVRILRRVRYADIRVSPLLYLRDALRDDQVARSLRHVPEINGDVIRLASSPDLWAHTSPRLLIETGSPAVERYETTWRTMRDTIAMYCELGVPLDAVVFRSREHLHAVHDEAAELLNRVGLRGAHIGAIPPPPIEGTDTIVPLQTVADFIREGREQRNCVATYAVRVADSARISRDGRPTFYVYQVLWPQRATLSIARCRGRWITEELRCSGNERPKEETAMWVKQWLDSPKKVVTPWNDSGMLTDYNEPVRAEHDEECLVPF